MEQRVPASFTLVVVLLLIATPVYLFPHAGEPVYSHSIERVPKSEVPEEANVLQYATLSKEAREAIEDARTGDGIVYGRANKPPEFFYSDYARLGKGIYYIRQNGTYYRLTTYAGGGLLDIELLLQWSLVLLGLTTGLIGSLSRRSQDWRPATAFGIYGSLLLVGAILRPEHRPLGLENFHLLLLALFGVGTSLVVFGAIARRESVLRATGVLLVSLAVASVLWLLQLLPIADVPALPVGPAVLLLVGVVPVLVSIGYGGQLVYHRLTSSPEQESPH